MKKITVYGMKIDTQEIKSTDRNDILKFVKMNRGKGKNEIIQVSLKVPEDRLKNVLENVSVKELYDYTENRKKTKKKNEKTTIRYTDLDKAVNEEISKYGEKLLEEKQRKESAANVAEKMILADTIKSGNLENDIEMASEIVDTMQNVLNEMFDG